MPNVARACRFPLHRRRLMIVPLVLALIIGITGAMAQRPTTATASPNAAQAVRHGAVGWDTYRQLDRLTEIGTDSRSRQFSSFDRAGGNEDGFDGRASCLREDNGCVIAERSGAGEISSIWFTRDGGDVTATGKITIELDGSVVLNAGLQDVVNGKVGAPFSYPLVANADQSSGGVYIKVPMTYRNSMKITTENNPLFYHVDYRTFATADGISTFDPSDRAEDVIKMLAAAGTADPKPAQPKSRTVSATNDVAPGKTAVLASSRAAGALTAISVRLPQLAQTPTAVGRSVPAKPSGSSIDPRKARWIRQDPLTARASATSEESDALLAGTRIRVTVDGQRTVDAPLGEFFGTGLGLYPVRSLMFGVDPVTKTLQAWWLMPYGNSVKVELYNGSDVPVQGAQTKITISDDPSWAGRLKSGEYGYFRATSAQERTELDHDHQFLQASGTGRVVGVAQTVVGQIPTGNLRNYLEGDERVFVDGSASPDWHGTGTEDFYEAGWYFNRSTFNAPMNGNTAHEEAGGGCSYDCTSMYRLLLADAVDFSSSVSFGIEHGPADDADAIEGSTTYWYGTDDRRLAWTDSVDLGNSSSERAHHYRPTSPSDPIYDETGRFEGIDGPDQPTVLDGRRTTGPVSFDLGIDTANRGVVLRRISDQTHPYQSVRVTVDGHAAGTWTEPLGNDHGSWLDDFFQLPAALTSGKSKIMIGLTPVDGSAAWDAADYRALSVIDNAANARAPSKITGLTAGVGEFASVGLSWKPATDDVYAPHYEVYASTTAGFKPGKANLAGTTRGSGFVHGGLDVRQTWHYRVRAIDDAGHAGAYSDETTVTTGDKLRIEAESLIGNAVATGPVQLQGDCCGVTWSGNAQLWFTPDSAGQTVTMTFDVGTAGSYRLSGRQTLAQDYGVNTLTLDGDQLGDPFDAYHAPEVAVSDPIDYGVRTLTAGQHTLVLTVTGKNDAAISYMAGLDYLQLELQD